MSEQLTKDGLRAIIRKMVEERGSQTAVAADMGISLAYLNDLYHGRRAVPDEMALKLGYERAYVPITR